MIVSPLKNCQLQAQVHDYRQCQSGQDYYFEAAAPAEIQAQQFYLTGWGKTIELNDQVLLHEGDQDCCFIVKQIEPFYNVADLWTALLQKVEIESLGFDCVNC